MNSKTPVLDSVRELKKTLEEQFAVVPAHLYAGVNAHKKLMDELAPEINEGVTLRTILGMDVHCDERQQADMMIATAEPLPA